MAQPTPRVSYEEYLALEAKAETKHEYLAGVIFAMAGGTPEHARLQMEVGGAFLAAARRRGCAVFSSDLRVRIEASDRSTYPDVTVVSGPLAASPRDPHAVTNPTVLVEVTSDSSEADDRGEKFSHYRLIPSLREYVIVSGRAPHVEVWRRSEVGRWELAAEAREGEVYVASIDARLDIKALYTSPLPPA
jgi:Uma2 family endonuclease